MAIKIGEAMHNLPYVLVGPDPPPSSRRCARCPRRPWAEFAHQVGPLVQCVKGAYRSTTNLNPNNQEDTHYWLGKINNFKKIEN